jgi:GntR family transcriptional regulator, transcriptional repressor for pyruvate dehydrogenase complex
LPISPIAVKKATPLKRRTLTAAAFEQLISYVVSGSWKPGERIPPERELCEQLGIARTSLREALKAMEHIGMLDSRVGEGTFVCPRSQFLSRPLLWAIMSTDHSELRDVMEARVLLEEDLAGLSAQRVTEKDIQKIGEAVQSMRAKVSECASVLEADMDFHSAVAETARNEVLGNAVRLLRNLLRQLISLKLTIPGVAENALKQHMEIYKAIQRRDAQGARYAMRKHLKTTEQLILTLAQKRGASTNKSVLVAKVEHFWPSPAAAKTELGASGQLIEIGGRGLARARRGIDARPSPQENGSGS